jgi:hypothetical protein
MDAQFRTLMLLSALLMAGCAPAMTPGLATIPSVEPVCLDLNYGRVMRLPERPRQLRLSPGARNGYVDRLGDSSTQRSGEWTHDGGSWLWITLPTSTTTLRYLLVTTGSTVQGQVTGDALRREDLPGVADVTGRLTSCPH